LLLYTFDIKTTTEFSNDKNSRIDYFNIYFVKIIFNYTFSTK